LVEVARLAEGGLLEGARAGIEGAGGREGGLAAVKVVGGARVVGRRVGRERRGGLVAEETLTGGRVEGTCSVVWRGRVTELLLIAVVVGGGDGGVSSGGRTPPLVRVVHGGLYMLRQC
jgi:hypothetical protein